MPRGDKDETTKAVEDCATGKTSGDDETLGEALSRAGFEPARVGRRVVSPGKRRETLKKRPSGNADK